MNALDRIRILIVENEGLVGCDIAATLTNLGYDVVGTCQSGEIAVSQAQELHPDLVLMDIHLAGSLDGIETAKRIQLVSAAAIVYVTACADLDTVARARETQPYGYLLKPFSEDELRLAVEVAATRYLEDVERRRREHSYFEAFQSLADGVIATDLAGVVIFMNPAAGRITGWASEEVAGRSLNEVFRIFHTGGEPAEVQVVDESGNLPQRTVWLTNKAGERVAIFDRTTALRDQRNSLTGLIILFRRLAPPSVVETQASHQGQNIITQHMVEPMPRELPPAAPAQEAAAKAAPVYQPAPAPDYHQPMPLPESHVSAPVANPAPLVDVVESISDPLIALDGLWRLTYVNAAGAKLLGRDKLSLLGTNFWDLMPSVIRDAHYETMAHAVLHREAISRDLYLEAQQIWLELRAYPFGEGLLILMKDITARHEEAERRNRIDRLESLGLLARGFAHDFNNLLTVLLGNLSLAEMRLRGNTERIPELATAKQATLQAQNLVQQLLTFARGGAPIKRQMKPGELIETFFQHHSRATGVHYRIEIQQGLPSIAVDPNQIRRLMGNLIRNAEQAMPAGGDLTLRCLAPNPEELYGGDMPPDMNEMPQGIVIEVKDTGEGIAPDHLPHIFEPYFSTRKAQNATGLGLTVCESIAKAHGGSLSVRSEHGSGCSVRFYLPVDADEETVDELGLTRTSFDFGANAAPRILILEDDPLVRSLITRNLVTQGFEVCETAEGTETIRRYQESMDQGRTFDLVVLDLTIPNGLGGVRTMERLRQLDPNVVAIVSSGYSDDPVMAKPAAYGFSAVLPKPYEPSDLLRLVKSVLNARGLRKDTKA
ncbi:MAG: multi-sensor hybrid histidine kinase [Verrucomicrobiaceae bacterium]|nr:multi-sensor hybrid histidine kinase [Verrucomicrobiaceae bacterium]